MKDSVILKLNAGSDIDLDVIASYITPENGNTYLIFSIRENQNGLAVLSAAEIKNANNVQYLEKVSDENWPVVKNLIKTEIEGVQIAVYNTELSDTFLEAQAGEYRRKLGVPQESLDTLRERYVAGLKEFNIRAQAPKIDVAPPVTLEGIPNQVQSPVAPVAPESAPSIPYGNISVGAPANPVVQPVQAPVVPVTPVAPSVSPQIGIYPQSPMSQATPVAQPLPEIPVNPMDIPVTQMAPQNESIIPGQQPLPGLPPILTQQPAPVVNEPIVPNVGVPYIEPPIVQNTAIQTAFNPVPAGTPNPSDVNIVDFLESLRQRLDAMEDVVYQVRDELEKIENMYK